ncbi:MAG TPA: extracellular solute-binding protein [Thermoanaerobaculia bacterium]|nr:extracellular solute-binding protein [Thermoanaerobaculia bacterium]
MRASRRNIVVGVVLAVLLVLAIILFWGPKSSAKEVNLLIWAGYEDPTILNEFKRANPDIKVNYKTFVGGDSMFSLLTQSHNQYDVVVVDPEYIDKLYAAKKLASLDPQDYDFTGYLEELKNFPLCWKSNRLYAIVVEFGSLGLVYNTRHISAQEAASYSILFSPKVKGRVAVWDWYLPIMGVLSRSLGNDQPYQISDAQFALLQSRLKQLRPQIAAIQPNFAALMAALANEDAWIVPGGAEWVASALQDQGKHFDWVVPPPGGVMWMDSLAIPVDAPHSEAAKVYIRWMMTPKAQALLSQKQAYHSNVPNLRAYDLMPAAHKDRLRIHNAQEMRDLLRHLAVRRLPVNQPEQVWQEAWENFKAGGTNK